jgi:DNA replication protein DnaC
MTEPLTTPDAQRPAATGGDTSTVFKCDKNCSTCPGYIRYEREVGHPKFGKVYRCPKLLREELFARGGGGLNADEVRELNWNLVEPGISDGHKARDAAVEITKRGCGMLLIYGDFGQGKTLVLKIAVATALRAGKGASYGNMSAILDDIRLAFDEKDGQSSALSRRIASWSSLEVLAIDELDKVNQTPWARERIHQLLDQRYMMAVRGEAITLISANFTQDGGLDDLDGYLASRLSDRRIGQVIELKGPDARKVMPDGFRY